MKNSLFHLLLDTHYWKNFIPKTWVCFKEGYKLSTFRSDFLAGITVGVIALPLAMAFAMASGASPEQGLITAIVAGFLISLLGGSRVQIGGPTGAFVVIILDIIQRQSYAGLVTATLFAGIILVLFALFRLGTWIKFIPYPLIMGFTTGIAFIIFSQQMKDFFGLKNVPKASNFIEGWNHFFHYLPSWDMITCLVSASTLILIVLIRRFMPIIPWAISAMVIMTLITSGFDLPIETIESRYGAIQGSWQLFTGPKFLWGWDSIKKLMPDAMTIAMLAGIESLLCAVIADGLIGQRHRPNAELMGQGIANMASALCGGIPATGALARTAANVKCGAKTPLAGIIHALTLLFVLFYLGPLVSKMPLGSLSAVLVVVAWNMAELDHFMRLLRSPKGDVSVLLLAFLLTVFVDITMAVQVGMVFAAFLFIHRMSKQKIVRDLKEVEKSDLHEFSKDPQAISKKNVPSGIEVYEITTSLFFPLVDSIREIMSNVEKPPHVFILRLRKVSDIDATGLRSLEELIHKCKRKKIQLVLSGVSKELESSINNFGLIPLIGKDNIQPHIDSALKRAEEILVKK